MSGINYDYTLVVLGNPKAQGRARIRRRGKFVSMHDDPKSAKEKDKLYLIAQQQAPPEPFEGPLKVDITFYFSRPKSHYGTGKNAGVLKKTAPYHHITKPDIDNLRKLVMDALSGVFYIDDKQVCIGTTIKTYDDRPRTVINIKKL